MKLLTSSGDAKIAHAIRSILHKKNGRRVILAAFVGKDCEQWVDNWEGVELWCWPKAGGTHPEAITRLLELGVDVQFCDKLHAKVYWSQTGGCLIGSANLTNNALGEKGLLEAALQIRSDIVNIDDLIDAFGLHKSPNADVLTQLNELRAKHALLPKPEGRSKGGARVDRKKTKPCTYLSWFEAKAPIPWQFSIWYEPGKVPSDLNKYRRERGQKEPKEWISAHKAGSLKNGIPALYLKLNNDTDRPYKYKKQPHWWLPSKYFKTSDAKYKENPHIFLAEVRGLDETLPPFDANDPIFLNAVDEALKSNSVQWPAKPITAQSTFAKKIYKAYQATTALSRKR